MAIDPSIPLAIRPAQISVPVLNPLESFGQMLSLRNLMQRGQLGQLDLQTKLLQFQQLEREMQERKDFAAWVAQRLNPAQAAPGAGTSASAAVPVTPSLPLVQPTPLGGTVAQTAPATVFAPAGTPSDVTTDFAPAGATTIAPNFGLPASPAGTMADLMTGGPPQPQPPAAMPAPGGQGGFGLGQFNISELARFPTIGPAVAKAFTEYQKSQYETQIKGHEAVAKAAARMGTLAKSILLAKDPAAAYQPVIWQAIREEAITPELGQRLLSHPFNANEVQRFVDQAQGLKDQSETNKTNLLADQEEQKKVAVLMRNVNDQAGFETKILPNVSPGMRAQLGDTFTPALKSVVQTWDVGGAQLPKAQLEQIQTDAVRLMGAMRQGPEAARAVFDSLDPNSQKVFAGVTTVQDVMQRSLTAEQATTAAQAAATATETAKQHGLQNVFEAVRVKIEGQKNAREERVYDLTYGEGANQALVGVAPNLRVQVSREAHKIGDEYRKAQAVADQMQSLIELTRAGNKAAGTNLPLVGVETVNAINQIKRINKDEIKQYGSAGSLLDKIQGRLSGLTVGQPIPADVLKDIETMHNTLRQNSEAEYRTRLEGLNRDYKSDFQPDKPSAHGVAPEVNKALQSGQSIQEALKNAAPGTYTADDGTKWLKKPGESAKQIK